ncbi:Mog1p/PsbP-like protein [Ceratobasidium sp. AG-I]|nr:Mog1p/PsbP-like protein [Ceratobasidium sp. AG-I]
MTTTKTYELFGGAITAILPSNLVDASDLRQVPDTQEVLMASDSDISVVVEILESVEPRDPNEVVKFHFDSLAHDNEAAPEFCTIEQIATPPLSTPDSGPTLSVLHGTQLVPKFNRTYPDTVKIFLAVFRVHEKNVDVVIVFNIPVEAEKEGSAVPLDGEIYKEWVKAYEEAVASFRIVDYGLFA